MSAKHTPGPWDLRDDDKRISVGIGLVDGPNGYDVAEVYNDDCDRDEAWANARLIAAAPDLRQAVRSLLALHIIHHNMPEHAAARALLRWIDLEEGE